MNQLQHIRSMAEMILSELDKFEGTQPVTKPDRVPKFKVGDRVQTRSGTQGVVTAVYYNCGAHCYDVQYVESKCPISGCYLESELHKVEVSKPEPKFKVGDRVVWLSALNEKVLTIVRVSHDQFNMDAHAAGRVTFPNETGVYFQYDVTTERGDIATFGEKALKMYVEPKVEEQTRIWHRGEPPHVGWWNASDVCNTDTWGQVWRWWDGKCWSVSAWPTHTMAYINQMANWKETSTNDIKWTDYWPDYARVPRIDPGV